MTMALNRPKPATQRSDELRVTYGDLRGLGVRDAECRIEPFLNWLRRLPPWQRITAAGEFSRCEMWIWARHFPREVPLVYGDYTWIGLNSA